MELRLIAVLAVLTSMLFMLSCGVVRDEGGGPAASTSPGGQKVAAESTQPPGETASPAGQASPGAGEGDVISSDGDTSEPGTPGTAPGAEGGGMPGSSSPTPARPPADAGGWRIYSNDQYGFEVRYPPSYVIVPSRGEPQPAPLLQVWFQDRDLASSDTADLEPPQFAISVYDNPSRQSLNDWLKSNGIIGDGKQFASDPVIVGGAPGIRLTSLLLLAPNTFVYVARGQFVYKFTPMGEFSEQMLDSVKFVK